MGFFWGAFFPDIQWVNESNLCLYSGKYFFDGVFPEFRLDVDKVNFCELPTLDSLK